MSEDTIHRALVQHLTWRLKPGVFWFHPANGGRRDKVTAARMKGLGVIPGAPDIILIASGRAYGLELKADRGRHSPAQIAVHDQMRGSGAIVETAYGLEEALAVLATWGLLRPGHNARTLQEQGAPCPSSSASAPPSASMLAG